MKHIIKKFNGGSSIIYLIIFIFIPLVHFIFADNQKNGLSKLTEDYTDDKIISNIIQFIFIIYFITIFTSNSLKKRSILVFNNLIEYSKKVLKKLGVDLSFIDNGIEFIKKKIPGNFLKNT